MRTILKILVEYVTTLLLVISFLMYWFFGPGTCGIPALWPGTEPQPTALEGEVSTMGPPGDSQSFCLSKKKNSVANMQYEKAFSLENIVKYIVTHFIILIDLFYYTF